LTNLNKRVESIDFREYKLDIRVRYDDGIMKAFRLQLKRTPARDVLKMLYNLNDITGCKLAQMAAGETLAVA
jgi:hypothetical protein